LKSGNVFEFAVATNIFTLIDENIRLGSAGRSFRLQTTACPRVQVKPIISTFGPLRVTGFDNATEFSPCQFDIGFCLSDNIEGPNKVGRKRISEVSPQVPESAAVEEQRAGIAVGEGAKQPQAVPSLLPSALIGHCRIHEDSDT